MSLKEILVIISVGFIIQGTFFAVFRADRLIDQEKIKDNPKEALKVQGMLLAGNLLFWGAIILFARFFLR